MPELESLLVKLVRVAKFYQALKHQDAALDWLEEQLKQKAPDLLNEFTQRWRKELDGNEALVASTPAPVAEDDRPRIERSNFVRIPKPGGGVLSVDLNAPIIPSGSFIWGEALHDGERIPRSPEHTTNIMALAAALEPVRRKIGKPFYITSWFRPEPWNSRVGGAKQSQHLTGKAVDIVVEGMTGKDLARIIRPIWSGGLGIYAHLPRLLHLDIGPNRTWGG